MSVDEEYHYTPLPEPVLITEQEWPDDVMPLVHTRSMTYNQEKFIRDCIEGILMQKTTFPVQVLIHDDSSTDQTAEIVREYEQKYPKLIKAYYQEENTYQIKKKHGTFGETRNEFSSWRVGKYEATCEGDDYWTDPLKLQKQIEFLEGNKKYSMVCTNYSVVDEEKRVLQQYGWEKKSKRKPLITQQTILEGYTPQLLTSVIRKDSLDKIRPDFYNFRYPNGDVALYAALTGFGPCHYMDEVTGCYRQTTGGIWAGKKIDKQLAMKFITMKNLLAYFSDNNTAKQSIYKKLNSTTRILSILSFKKADPIATVKYLYYYFYFKLKSRVLPG